MIQGFAERHLRRAARMLKLGAPARLVAWYVWRALLAYERDGHAPLELRELREAAQRNAPGSSS